MAGSTPRTAPRGRLVTILAVGSLALDGLLLALAGFQTGRVSLVGGGASLLAAAGVVIIAWRRHLRRLDEIAGAKRSLRAEAEALRELLGSGGAPPAGP